MIYAAAGLAGLLIVGGVLYLVGRGAERRERAHQHRRGLKAGAGGDDGAGYAGYAAGLGGDLFGGGGDCGSGGGGDGCH